MWQGGAELGPSIYLSRPAYLELTQNTDLLVCPFGKNSQAALCFFIKL